MATASRSKSPARRKPPARTRKTPAPPTPIPTSLASETAPTEAVASAGQEAIADARDRAADILDLAADQARVVAGNTRSAQTRLEALREQIAQGQREHADHLHEVEQVRGSARAQLDTAHETAQRIADLTASQMAAAKQAVAEHRGEAERILARAQRQAQAVADRLIAQARRDVDALLDGASADRAAAAQERETAEQELTRAHQRTKEIGATATDLHRQAEQAVRQIRETALKEAEQQREQARAAAQQIRQDADQALAAARETQAAADKSLSDVTEQTELDARRARLELAEELAADRRIAQQARDELQAELKQTGEAFDAEADTKRQALKEDLAQLTTAAQATREELLAAAQTDAKAVRVKAEKDAADVRAAAEKIAAQAQSTVLRAERMLAEAREEARRTSKLRSIGQALSRNVWRLAPWVALAAGVGLAASGEYELARLVGIHYLIAPLLPVSIDVYCVTAFRAKKDIAPALLLMASANLVFHLTDQMGWAKHGAPWPIISFVVLIFVAVIWRVHSLLGPHDGERTPDVRTDAGRTGPLHTSRPHAARTVPSEPYGRTDTTRTAAPATRTASAADPAAAPGAGPTVGGPTGAYTDRTGNVRPPYGAGSAADRTGRTGEPRTARTGAASGGRTDRTGRTSGSRTDAQALAYIKKMPRETDGFINVNKVRTALGCNQNRAVRLLNEAGLLRPEDAAKYLG